MSQVAASNFPAGSDSPANLDDVQRAQASFIALLRDGKGLSAPVTLASAATTDIGGQNSPFVEISGTTGITSLGTNYNGPRYLRFTGALLLTHNATTLNLPGAANITTVAGDTAIAYPNQALSGWNVVQYQRAAALPATAGANSDITSLTALTSINILSGYLFGCTLSTAGSSATMSIAAGKAQDSTGVQLMTLTAIAKTTSAWAVGTAAGGLDTGAIANSTWYHFYVIRRPDTGVVDVVFSTNAATPTLPANYTQFRRIGSGKTNGSAQWVKFIQNGDHFEWDVTTVDVNVTTSLGTTPVAYTFSVPTGVIVEADIRGYVSHASAGVGVRVTNPSVAGAIAGAEDATAVVPSAGGIGAFGARVMTNTSAQVQAASTTASTTFRCSAYGWTDSRGKDS